MRQLPIYLDHHATTPVDPRVVEAMAPYWSADFGNASSATHAYGWRADAAVEQAREAIAAAIGAAEPSEIVFTSGTTESDNLALIGLARSRGRRERLVTTAIEHPAVLDTARALADEGHEVLELPVDGDGELELDALRGALGERCAWVSVGAANGEVGTLQPLAEIGAICRDAGVPFHSDAAQAVGKLPIDVRASGIDLLSFCAHKLYGPKGIGALYRRRDARLRLAPLFHGGGHERGLRSGTLAVPLIVGFARAIEIGVEEMEGEAARLRELRGRLLRGLCERLAGVEVNGGLERRLPGNLNLAFEGVRADALLAELRDVALSAGSACASARGEPSHVLTALGLSPERVRSSLRFGLGRGNDATQIDAVIERVVGAVEALRSRRAGGRAEAPIRARGG